MTLSDTILGTPFSFTTSLIKISAISMFLLVDHTGMKCAVLVSLSTTTMMKACCFTNLVNLVIKSIVITSHFHSGSGKDCNNPIGCRCSNLTFVKPFDNHARGYILCHVLFHIWAEILLSHRNNGFLVTQMTCICNIVHLSQEKLSHLH
jgi:hypothetical protein